jgi:hypothetical protein
MRQVKLDWAQGSGLAFRFGNSAFLILNLAVGGGLAGKSERADGVSGFNAGGLCADLCELILRISSAGDALFSSQFGPLNCLCVPFAVSGVARRRKLCYTRYIFWFGPDGIELGFHEEWLRDEPCDATTTGRCKTGSRCQLSPGNGGHEIRKMDWPAGRKPFRI